MKKLFLWIVMTGTLPVFGRQSLELRYPRYTLTALGSLRNRPEADVGVIVAAKLDSVQKKSEKSRFGLLFRTGSKASGTAILEILDGETNQSLKRVSLDEYYGKASAGWKPAAEQSSSSAASIVSVFAISQKNLDAVLTRTISLVEDRAVPTGKSIRVSFEVESRTARALALALHFSIEGTATANNSIVTITNSDATVGIHPALVVAFTGAKQLLVDAPKKGRTQSMTVTSGSVPAPALLSYTVAGTTVWTDENIAKQARNIVSYFNSGKTAPNIEVATVRDKEKVSPGDTIRFTLYCQNVGTSVATGAEVSNPIPQGTQYVEGSAAGEGSTISFQKSDTLVTSVKWLFQSPLQVAEERSVTFQVVLR